MGVFLEVSTTIKILTPDKRLYIRGKVKIYRGFKTDSPASNFN